MVSRSAVTDACAGVAARVRAAAAKKGKKPSSPLATRYPAALFESFVSKVTGDDKDSELVRSLKQKVAEATAEVKAAEREEREVLRSGGPILRSTAKEREELSRAKAEAQRAAERAQRLAAEAMEAAEELARAVAKTK